MDFISGLYVGPAPAPRAGFTMWTGRGGVPPSFAAASSSAARVYLWVAKSREEAITDARLLFRDVPVPDGFSVVSPATEDACGAFQGLRIAYKTSPVVAPVSAGDGLSLEDNRAHPVVAVYVTPRGSGGPSNKDEPSVLPGLRTVFEKVRHVTGSGRGNSAGSGDSAAAYETPSLGVEMYLEVALLPRVGDSIRCVDQGKVCRSARIVAVSDYSREATVDVSFDGWPAKYNETELYHSSDRLAWAGPAPASSHRSCPADGGVSVGEFEHKDVQDALDFYGMRIDDYITGDMPQRDVKRFMEMELPGFVEKALGAKYAVNRVCERVNAVLQKVLELCVYHIKRLHEPLPVEVMEHLKRLFWGDFYCNSFFNHHGRVYDYEEKARDARGVIAGVPSTGCTSRFFVTNLNYFHRLGGYDAILLRLQYTNTLARLASKGQLTDRLAGQHYPDVETVISASVNADLDEYYPDPSPSSGPGARGGAAEIPARPRYISRGKPTGAINSIVTIASHVSGALSAPYGCGYRRRDFYSPSAEAELYTQMLTLQLPYGHCKTPKFAQKYYQPLRWAILGRILSLTPSQFQHCDQEHLWRIKLSLRDLGYSLGPETAAALEPLEEEADITRRPSTRGSALASQVDAYVSGAMPAEERAAFLKTEFPAAVNAILGTRYLSPELPARLAPMIPKALELCVYHLKRFHEPMPAGALKPLGRLLAGDFYYKDFFHNYGKVKPYEPEAQAASGYAARVPAEGASHYFVSAANHFHRLGGYDAILLRLQYTNSLARLANKGQLTAQLANKLRPDIEAVISASVNADLDSVHSQTSSRPVLRSSSSAAAAPDAGRPRYIPCGAPDSAPMPQLPSSQQASYGPLGCAGGLAAGEEAGVYADLLGAGHLCYTPQFAKKTLVPLKAAIMDGALKLASPEHGSRCFSHLVSIRRAFDQLAPLTDEPGSQTLNQWAITLSERLVEVATGQPHKQYDDEHASSSSATSGQATPEPPLVRLFGLLVSAWGQEKANELLMEAVLQPSFKVTPSLFGACWFHGLLQGVPSSMYCPRLLGVLERSGVSSSELLRRLVRGYKPSDLLPPLHVAARRNDGELCTAVIGAGASVDAKNSRGQTALLLAASAGCRQSCLALLGSGASRNASCGESGGLKPFHAAVSKGHVAVCELILDYGDASNESRAKATLNGEVGGSGDTALHLAARKDLGAMTTWLMERGASPSVTNEDAHTPLQLATTSRNKFAALALLGCGVTFSSSASEVAEAGAGAGQQQEQYDDKLYDAFGQEIPLTRLDRWNNRLAKLLSKEIAAMGPQAPATPLALLNRGFVRWACSLPLYVLQKYGGTAWAPPAASASRRTTDAIACTRGSEGGKSDGGASGVAASARRTALISALGDDAWDRRKHVVVAFLARREAMRGKRTRL